MKKILLILTFYLLKAAVFSDIPCLTWEMTSDKLDIICRLDNVVLPVSIYDNFGNEQGKCVFKDNSSLCLSLNQLSNITASYSKGELKLSITNVTRSLVEGEWSCIQGTQTFKNAVSPAAGIISSTGVVLTGYISRHQNSMDIVNLSCFSCREPHGNNVEFLMNHHSVVNVRYDHVTKRCLHKDVECRPDQCTCSNSGNWFTYTFEITDITAQTSFSCGMRFVDKLISTRFLKFSSVIYDGKELKSIGSETVITKAPVIHHENDKDNSPDTPVKEDANITKTGLKWSFIAVAVVLPVLLIFLICYCFKRIRKESPLRKSITETVELSQPLLIDNEEPKHHTENVGKLVLLIANIAKKVIKRVVTCTLLTDDQTFTSYLQNENNKHTLFHAWHNKKRCCQCKPDDNGQKESLLTKKQFQIMFNNNGSVPQSHEHEIGSKIYCLYNIAVNENVSLDDLDVSVANCLLVCGCTPDIKPEISEIKTILDSMKIVKGKRDEICDMAGLNNLSDNEFMDNWQKIQKPVVDLASVVDSDFCNEIKGEINVLQNENLEDTTACAEKLTRLLMQSKQDMNLKINQLCEEKFMLKLTESGKLTNSDRTKDKNMFTKVDQLSLNIVETPDVKIDDYPDRTTLDVLLRVQAPNDWNVDEIMEIIRQNVDKINSRGNIKINETTLEDFMLIGEIRIATLIEEELVKNEIEDFFRIICLQCNVDITVSNTIEVSIENLSHTNDQVMISNAENDIDDETIVNQATPPQLMIAFEEDCTESKFTDQVMISSAENVNDGKTIVNPATPPQLTLAVEKDCTESKFTDHIMLSRAENDICGESIVNPSTPPQLMLAFEEDCTESKFTDPLLDERPSDVELAFIKSFVVQKDKDAFFTSCAVWSNDHYILLDLNNTLLITYNHKTGDIQSVDLRNQPFSMAIIDNNNVAISFPERQEINIYSLHTSKTFECKEVIKVTSKCFTLTKKDDGTLLVYIDEKGIHSFDMSKKEFKSLDIHIPYFVPHSDEICTRKNRLYHTSRSTSSVFCYDMNGSMLWNFERVLKRPTALTCDKFGNVYVSDYTSHRLYFISADGLSHKTLLSREDKLWHPTFVYYCMKRKCLLIVNRDNGYGACYSVN